MDCTLREIDSAIGTPLLIDSATQNRVFGHYACILVDMDLSKHIFNEVMIEREGYSFAIEVTYERLPSFCTHCRNIGHHITSCRWLHAAKDTQVIDKQKNTIVSQKQQVPKWQPKDNPDSIGSSRALEAPVITNTVAATTISQVDAIPLQIEPKDKAGQEEEVEDVSISVTQLAAQTDLQTDTVTTAMTFTYEKNVDTEIHQERLPSTSVHVLEEIIETQDDRQQDTADGATAATPQSSSMDVMALEHSANMQTRPTDTEANLRVETHDVNNIPVRAAPIQHQEIPVSKNVQSDLDLWARIREYDQRVADEGLTQVLSKKQQQVMKKQVLGKASYNTRAKVHILPLNESPLLEYPRFCYWFCFCWYWI